jgi:hypothetical protein
LTTTKIKFFLGLLPIFVAHEPTNQPQFLWAQPKFSSGEICPFGEASKLKCYAAGFCPFWGPLGPFGVQGLKIKFYSGDIFPFGESLKLKFYCGDFAHFVSPLGPFGVQGLKIKLYSGAFFLLGSLPNSNFTAGI